MTPVLDAVRREELRKLAEELADGAKDLMRSAYNREAFDRAATGIFALLAYIAELEAGLSWYGEQAAGCRKLGSIGDPFRHALDSDGGKRAAALLPKASVREERG